MTNFLNGLSAFPITPADATGKVDTPALKRLLAPLVEAKVDSIGLLGSTGSYPFLSRAERRRATDTALQEVQSHVPVLVGIGALRTDEAIALAQDPVRTVADDGVDAERQDQLDVGQLVDGPHVQPIAGRMDPLDV